MKAASARIVTFRRTPEGGACAEFRLRNAKGRTIIRHAMAWRTEDELDHFMSLASTQELMRAALRERLRSN